MLVPSVIQRIFFFSQVIWLLAILVSSVSISEATQLPSLDTSIVRRQSVSNATLRSFTDASWIWTSEASHPNAPVEDCAFRKTYTTPSGKTATSAAIIMTVDDGFTLYLNGAVVGAAPNVTDGWKSAQVFTAALSPAVNLFAVLAFNRADPNTGGESPAGLLASIQISFSDGTSAIIVSDSTWKATKTIPPQFQSLATDDSQWGSASVLGAFGSGPWGSTITLPSSGPALSLNGSAWIWSSESDAKPNAPAGSRAFRNTYTVPNGKEAVGITAIVTADNSFVLYLNGQIVGTSPTGVSAWQTAERYTPNVLQSSDVAPSQFLFAINATNDPDASGNDTPAGLLAAIQVSYSDGTFDIHRSDSTWLVDKTVASDFFQVSTSDSTWSNATTIGLYGIQPWSNVAISAASASSVPHSISSASSTSTPTSTFTAPLFTPTSTPSNSPDTVTTAGANSVSLPATTTSSNAATHSTRTSIVTILSALALGAIVYLK